MYINAIQFLYVILLDPSPRIFLRPNYLQQGIIGEPHDIVCSAVLNSTLPTSLVYLTWNFTSNDTRVRVIPATITTDDSIGVIYTTVIQFDYLIGEDEGNYTCLLSFKIYSAESTFHLKTISKGHNHQLVNYVIMFIDFLVCWYKTLGFCMHIFPV